MDHHGKTNHKKYSTANRSLFRHVVCCVPVTCKANGVENQLVAWRYSDLLVILYLEDSKARTCQIKRVV